jgi:capsular polysaccharide biosynthesis protein
LAKGRAGGRSLSVWPERLIGIVLGLLLGIAIVIVFVFVFSEQAVDDPSIDRDPIERPER